MKRCCLLILTCLPFITSHAETDQIIAASPFAEAIQQTQQSVFADNYAGSSPYTRRISNEFVAGLVDSAWRLSRMARRLDRPEFQSGTEVVGLPGLYNPDNIYSSALLQDQGIYRISGIRGSHAHFTLQFIDSFPLIALSKQLFSIDMGEHGVEPGDNFEIFLGGPKQDGLWWPMPAGAQAVLTRQTFSNWHSETPTTLSIERLDGPDSTIDTDRLELAAQYLRMTTSLWANHYMKGLRRLPANVIPPILRSKDRDGGLGGQQTAMARFDLAADEALIVVARASDATYQSIQLGDYWFVTPDPTKHLSSLSIDQSQVGEDGAIHYVVSASDPGVANWLDTGGGLQGYILLRWQGIQSPVDAAHQPVATRVKLEDIQQHLPDNTKRVSAAFREQQIGQRRDVPTWKDR